MDIEGVWHVYVVGAGTIHVSRDRVSMCEPWLGGPSLLSHTPGTEYRLTTTQGAFGTVRRRGKPELERSCS